MARLTRRDFVRGTLATIGAAGAAALPPRSAGADVQVPAAGNGSILQPGLRIVWFGEAASIPGSYTSLEPDPNGQWVNKSTGQRFNESAVPGGGGAGYTVSDIIAAGPTGFLIWDTSLLIHTDQGNVASFIDSYGVVAGPTNVTDYWIAPANLAAMAETNTPSYRVLRGPYLLDGRNYRVVHIQVESNSGWTQETYDLDTGLLLVESTAAQGQAVLTRQPGNTVGTGAGSMELTFSRLSAMRRTNLPGPGESYPASLRNAHSLFYAGSRTSIIPGPPLPSFQVQTRYDIESNPGPYLTARLSTAGSPDTQERLVPAGVIGSFWMNPQYLSRLGANQMLDQDPVTGVQTISAGQRSGFAYLMLQTGLARTTMGYDLRNGMLGYVEFRQQVGPATNIITMQLAGVQ
jgi:hypothetical protein